MVYTATFSDTDTCCYSNNKSPSPPNKTSTIQNKKTQNLQTWSIYFVHDKNKKLHNTFKTNLTVKDHNVSKVIYKDIISEGRSFVKHVVKSILEDNPLPRYLTLIEGTRYQWVTHSPPTPQMSGSMPALPEVRTSSSLLFQ